MAADTAQVIDNNEATSESAAIAALRRQIEQQNAQLERLKTLGTLDGLLIALTDVLDVRQVFDRVSEIAQRVLPHDGMLIGQVIDEGARVRMYATTGLGSVTSVDVANLSPHLLTAPWEFQLVGDIRQHPELSQSTVVQFGMQSALFVPVRVEDTLWGGLSFYGRTIGQFTEHDVLVAKRIADYVTLALSHQRLAEQARMHEALRAKAAKAELLDALLAAVTDTGELPEVFDRISTASQNVLAHDALVLTAVLPSGTEAKTYAKKTAKGHELPDVVKVPPLMRRDPDWDHDLVDDLQARPDQAGLDAAKAGYRSVLRVAIRLEGEYAAGLSFLSLQPSQYQEEDIAAARRIADRITLSFARERTKALARQADEATTRAERLESRVRALTDELNARSGYHRVIGKSPSWRAVLTQAAQVGPTETTVLLLGESGTGKEVVARFIHRASARTRAPFVALNCAALPDQLLESELFGYERGAFTSAAQSKAGQLEQASGGTLFLDEVGEMSLQVQPKLLRVLQEREFQRLGGTRVIKADVRIVAATNKDLESAIERSQFREDLYYRLNVFAIRLPPLRDRRDDILALSEAFLADLARSLGRPPGGLSEEARRALLDYHWPGNVRELRNLLERAAILSEGGLIVREHFAFRAAPANTTTPTSAPATAQPDTGGDLKTVERSMIEQALVTAKYNKSKAAKALGVTRAQLYVKLRQYGLG
jgi:transcriptional regulator with GAF, ATPase, and Fis domain